MPDAMHVLDLLPAYVLGSLESDEVNAVEEHLLSCLICRTRLKALQNVADELSFAVPAATPPSDLKNRLIQRVQTVHSRKKIIDYKSRKSWLERFLPVWGITSLGLIIVLLVFNLALWQRLNHIEVITAPGGMWAVSLTGTSEAPNATGFIVIGPNGRNGALVVDRLPPLKKGQQYQLWLVRDGQTISGAVFSADEENYGSTRIETDESLFEYSAVDVTIEPSGGSLQPTGTKVLGGLLFVPRFLLTPSG
jgi:anti-sigma-K factor RskA